MSQLTASTMVQTYILASILLLIVTKAPSLTQGQQQQFQYSQLPQTLQPQSPNPTGQRQLQPQPQQPQPCPRAIKINTNHMFRRTLHFICLQATGGRPRLDVIQYADRRLVWSMEVLEPDVNQLASFVDETGILRIILSMSNRLNGTSMYSLDPMGQVINETHTINTQLVSALLIWRMELNLEWHLAVANQPAYDTPYDPKPMLTVLSWRSTYFDQYQMIYLPESGRVNKLEQMNINGQEFLIVAMESIMDEQQQPDEFGSDSLIYRLDFGDGKLRWLEYQRLNTRIALDVKAFSITHRSSLQRDYYIAVVGQANLDPFEMTNDFYDNNNYTQTNKSTTMYSNNQHPYGLMIYKYFGDRFRRTEHSLPLAGAIKLDTITYGDGDSYVIIALLSGGSNFVNVYLFDGLMLRPMPGPSAGPPAPPTPVVGHPYFRQRRTMENSANLHLFLAPPEGATGEDQENSNGTNQKRTLTNESLGIQSPLNTMPALALSTSDVAEYENIDGSTMTKAADTESVYHIPVNDMIKDGQVEQQQQQLKSNDSQQTGYQKRNFTGPPVGPEFLLGWCKRKIDELLADNFNLVGQRLGALPRINQPTPIRLDGNLFIEGDLYVSNLLHAKQIHRIVNSTQSDAVESTQFIYSNTFEQIQRANMDILGIEQRVNRILVEDGTLQEVFNPISFDTLIVDCVSSERWDPRNPYANMAAPGAGCPYINELRTSRVNSRNVSNIQQQALLTGRPMEIFGDVRFEHLVLRGRVEILHSLNGYNIHDIVFKRGPTAGKIVGHKTFMKGLYSSSAMAISRWHNATVDRNNFLTSSGDQRIEANLHLARVVVDTPPPPPGSMGYLGGGSNISSRIEMLNGQHLDSFLNQIAVADDSNTFENQLLFDELVLNGPIKLTDNSRFCRLDLENFWYNTMFKHARQNITAPMRFADDVHMSYGGDIIVDNLLNGVVFNPATVVMRSSSLAITNPIVFDSDVYVDRLQVNRALNGIQVLRNEMGTQELAILYNGGYQLITGDKIFSQVHLGGRSYIRGNINGHLNISQLFTMANLNGVPHRFAQVKMNSLGGVLRVANGIDVHIDSSVNGIPTNDLCHLANQISQQPHLAFKRLRFEQPIRFKSLRCASINSFNNLSRSFLTRHGNQYVAGNVRLLNGVVFNSSVSIGSSLNNLPVTNLAGAIARSVNETRSGHKDVMGDLVLDELYADRMNNLNLANVFLSRSDEPQFVRAPMTFDHLDIENVLVVGRSLETRHFNGLDVNDILANTLQYDTPQVVYNHMELSTLQLMANSSFLTKSVNGHDLQRLLADSVLRDVPQQILGPKTFRAPAEFVDRVQLRHGIDELTANELRFNLLLLHGSDNLIEGDVEFMNDVTIKRELELLSGMINDIDINQFADSMLYESSKAMRIVNGSVRFKDVKVNNLVVAGRIQGIDLSREALLRSENVNGSYDARIREQQALLNNQRLLNSRYGPGSSFRVRSSYRGSDHQGTCYIHSCAPRNFGMLPAPPQPPQLPVFQQLPQPDALVHYPRPPPPPYPVTQPPPPRPVYQPMMRPQLPQPQPPQPMGPPPMGPPIKFVQQFYPNILPPEPVSLVRVNNTRPPHLQQQSYWRPNWNMVLYNPVQQQQLLNQTVQALGERHQNATNTLVDPSYLEHNSRLRAQAISDLSYRINRYLLTSFYYDIIQKHPLLGPLLHATRNPILAEQGSAHLLLKGTSKQGEPCLLRGQTIAVMGQQRHRNGLMSFTEISRIQETSNPVAVASVVVEQVGHYLFILDSYPEGSHRMVSQVLVYLWDHKSNMYEQSERFEVDGFPTSMRALTVNRVACIAMATPTVTTHSFNRTGAPLFYCQESPRSRFRLKISLPLANVFDMDVMTIPGSGQIVIATLSQQHTEQIGDLSVGVFDLFGSRSWSSLALKRMVRPMKLHFFRDLLRPMSIKLAVSEAITSSDDTQALTRIFVLKLGQNNFYNNNKTHQFYESQIIRDNQFYDIQSVHLDNMHSMLFLQSAHSISIYAPTDCEDQYSLVQRLPTKGANKFLVFNDHYSNYTTAATTTTTQSGPFGHFLVLSKDDCEQQHYATLILKMVQNK